MTYTEEFKHILEKRDKILNANLFVFRNNSPGSMKVFPKEVSSVLLDKYFDALSASVEEKQFVPFIPDSIERGTLQVIGTDLLTLWPGMLKARDALSAVNREEITVDDYNCKGNTILMDIEFDDDSHVYFLTVYRNVAAWYRNNIRFTKLQTGKFRQQEGEVLALTPWVDAVISGDRCYIINEANFNRIFKFDEVIKHQIEQSKKEIHNMGFIDDGNAFMDLLGKSVRQRNAMAKVILQKRLVKIKKFTPTYIREQIESQPKLSFISYTSDDKIIINEESFDTVMDILCGKINLDLITKELNGLAEENE